MNERLIKEEGVELAETATLKPVIILCVTLGKELHAGHALLLSTADLLKVGLGEESPIYLINNNTGPRAGGTLVAATERMNLPLEEAARNLTQAILPVDEVISAYRNRIEQGEIFEQAVELLDQGQHDIFAAVAQNVQSKLNEVGFEVKVTPESELLSLSQDIIEQVNPVWRNTGFMFSTEKGVKILKKGGRLTATGKSLVSLLGLSQPVLESGGKTMPIFIDASTDALDSVNVFSSLPEFGQAALLPGAGVSFAGGIASGTQGEALTLSELTATFKAKCPAGSLLSALRQMVLTTPVAKDKGTILSLYDFRDNDSLVDALVGSYKLSLEFKREMDELIDNLRARVGSFRVSDKNEDKWLQFLPQRTAALLNVKIGEVLNFMNNFSPLKNPEDIGLAVKRQGYRGKEMDAKILEYATGQQKGLFYRNNYFFNVIRSILRQQERIVSLTQHDFNLLETAIKFCLRRLGYDIV